MILHKFFPQNNTKNDTPARFWQFSNFTNNHEYLRMTTNNHGLSQMSSSHYSWIYSSKMIFPSCFVPLKGENKHVPEWNFTVLFSFWSSPPSACLPSPLSIIITVILPFPHLFNCVGGIGEQAAFVGQTVEVIGTDFKAVKSDWPRAVCNNASHKEMLNGTGHQDCMNKAQTHANNFPNNWQWPKSGWKGYKIAKIEQNGSQLLQLWGTGIIVVGKRIDETSYRIFLPLLSFQIFSPVN